MEGKRLNILVTGGCGQLGCCLRDAVKDSANHYIFTDVAELPGLDTVHLDITDREALKAIAEKESVDIFVNCAGYTNVEKAEDDVAFAKLLNATAVEGIAAVAAERGATLIHISTDFVFGGDATAPIPEDACPAPLSVYGATKLEGEKAAAGCKSIILRTAWLFSQYGKNFVKTMLSLTADRPQIKVVADQTGTPTYARDLAGLIVHIIDTGQYGKTGIYHFTNEGVATWHEFAKAVNDLAGHSCDVQPCRTDEYPAKARRPRYSVLDKSLVKKTFGISIPDWHDALKDCIEILK